MTDDGRNGVDEAIVEVERVCRGGAPEYPWAIAKLLAAELKRYRGREPLVQELLEAWNLWTGQEMYGELIREGMVPSDFEAWQSTVDAVRDFKLSASAAAGDESA